MRVGFRFPWASTVRRDERPLSVIGRHARLDLTFLYRSGRTVLAEAYAEPPFRVGRWFEAHRGRLLSIPPPHQISRWPDCCEIAGFERPDRSRPAGSPCYPRIHR